MTYVYKCTECGHEQEEVHGMNDSPEVTCELCCGKAEKMITGGAGFHLKGPGFHKNDYPKRS